MLWYLEPADVPSPLNTNPLPDKGVYRLRTFEGTDLMTMPSSDASAYDGAVFIKQQVKPSNQYQQVG